MTTKPTAEQAQALLRFSEAHGRQWKEKLADHWMGAQVRVQEADRHLLRQVRNQLGPRWMSDVTLADLKNFTNPETQSCPSTK